MRTFQQIVGWLGILGLLMGIQGVAAQEDKGVLKLGDTITTVIDSSADVFQASYHSYTLEGVTVGQTISLRLETPNREVGNPISLDLSNADKLLEAVDSYSGSVEIVIQVYQLRGRPPFRLIITDPYYGEAHNEYTLSLTNGNRLIEKALGSLRPGDSVQGVYSTASYELAMYQLQVNQTQLLTIRLDSQDNNLVYFISPAHGGDMPYLEHSFEDTYIKVYRLFGPTEYQIRISEIRTTGSSYPYTLSVAAGDTLTDLQSPLAFDTAAVFKLPATGDQLLAFPLKGVRRNRYFSLRFGGATLDDNIHTEVLAANDRVEFPIFVTEGYMIDGILYQVYKLQWNAPYVLYIRGVKPENEYHISLLRGDARDKALLGTFAVNSPISGSLTRERQTLALYTLDTHAQQTVTLNLTLSQPNIYIQLRSANNTLTPKKRSETELTGTNTNSVSKDRI